MEFINIMKKQGIDDEQIALSLFVSYCTYQIDEDELYDSVEKLNEEDLAKGYNMFRITYLKDRDVSFYNPYKMRDTYDDQTLYKKLDTCNVDINDLYRILVDLDAKKKIYKAFKTSDLFKKDYNNKIVNTLSYMTDNVASILDNSANTCTEKHCRQALSNITLNMIELLRDDAFDTLLSDLQISLGLLEMGQDVLNRKGKSLGDEFNTLKHLIKNDIEFLKTHPNPKYVTSNDPNFDELCLEYFNKYHDINFLREAKLKEYAIFYRDCK